MLRAAFVMAALDAGVPSRDVEIAARHADQRNTTAYERRRQNYDRHAAYARLRRRYQRPIEPARVPEWRRASDTPWCGFNRSGR